MTSFSWSTHAVRGLIKIWGEDKIKKILDGTKRNTLAYDAMVEGLQADYNFITTRAQVISKTKYLKKQFATGKKYNRSGVSLDDILKVCPFWEELKPILDAGKNIIIKCKISLLKLNLETSSSLFPFKSLHSKFQIHITSRCSMPMKSLLSNNFNYYDDQSFYYCPKIFRNN